LNFDPAMMGTKVQWRDFKKRGFSTAFFLFLFLETHKKLD
jgi:hypothetical protein